MVNGMQGIKKPLLRKDEVEAYLFVWWGGGVLLTCCRYHGICVYYDYLMAVVLFMVLKINAEAIIQLL